MISCLSLLRLAHALREIDSRLTDAPAELADGPLPLPPQRMGMLAARRLPGQPVPLEEAAGRVCGEMVWAYPPGVPLLVPGEEVTAELCRTFKRMEAGGVVLHGEKSAPPRTVWTVKNGGV